VDMSDFCEDILRNAIAAKSLLASASCPCHPFADGGAAKRKSAVARREV
jgi:hypothetical protein